MVCDVINYSDVMSATNSYVFIENVHLTDMYTVSQKKQDT